MAARASGTYQFSALVPERLMASNASRETKRSMAEVATRYTLSRGCWRTVTSSATPVGTAASSGTSRYSSPSATEIRA